MFDQLNVIYATDLNNAWRDAMHTVVRNGWDFMVKGGSYVGQIRKQLPWTVVMIEKPGSRPLSPILPPGIPAPTNDDKIIKYFLRYIMGTEIQGNETYSYGEFIQPQLRRVLDILVRSKGFTNQAIIRVGDEESDSSPDPACLRSVAFKVVSGRLNMCLYFRSWDMYAGFPENLGGLQLLKEYALSYLEDFFPVVDGEIIAFSDGLHLYEQYFDLANQLNVDKIQIADSAAMDKLEFLRENGV